MSFFFSLFGFVIDLEWNTTDGEQAAYRRYRLYTIHRLPKLHFLDSTEITEEERKEAKRVGANMAVRRPIPGSEAMNSSSSGSGGDLAESGGTPKSLSSPEVGSYNMSAEEEKAMTLRRQRQKEELLSHRPKAAAFLARGKPRYDGSNSEGNRFIMNDDL